jgi:peptidoglycan/xylan/chitin deacetylase (PgdA/CDA1 family)
MRRAVATLFAAFGCLALAACMGASAGDEAQARTPAPPPKVVLTPQEKKVWAPLPPDRSSVPVLLYHGIAPASAFANADDAAYGVDPQAFAKQMTMIRHAGYRTITLDTFVRFVQGEHVKLPPRPLLLTFDDGRADSWTGSEGILRKLGFKAVMFVDVGRVDAGEPEYLTWPELSGMQQGGRWELQLHSGEGHVYITYGPGPDDVGPYYTSLEEDEDIEGWRDRAFSDLTWGEDQLAEMISGHRRVAFAPPYGQYGQEETNDSRIEGELLGWLEERYAAIFTQDESPFAEPGGSQPFGRIEVTRSMTGGQLHSLLVAGPQPTG